MGLLKEGFLRFYDGDEILMDIECYVENEAEVHPDKTEDACQVAGFVQTIANKCYAIDALFESIQEDLSLLELNTRDDNGKEIAGVLKSKFRKAYENYYWQVHETEGGDWMDYSYLHLLCHLCRNNKQALVIPELRRGFQDVTEGDFTEEYFQEQLAHLRQQFGLSEDFK